MAIMNYRCERPGNEFPKLVLNPANAPLGQCPVCAAENPTELGNRVFSHR